MNLRFVLASAADRDYLLILRKATLVEHLEQAGIFLSDSEHEIRLDDQYDCSYIIFNGPDRLGTLKYQELASCFNILQLQIEPSHQGQGWGKHVLQIVQSWAAQKSKSVTLTVLKENPAKQLYQRLGFNIVGEDKYEYHLRYQP
ncbi:GNAT family N-acetyltransferase [Flocculibacter collagenilyticus]|uniref:GNAT family N-acetyltransferase n=1 Tax=Flocculibacter collagenilyticus TaxID=2744479 RepID=UPI0018F59587|nr:GNAT family N-acetyltransferase [Flocculibacter collagenilyticus]